MLCHLFDPTDTQLCRREVIRQSGKIFVDGLLMALGLESSVSCAVKTLLIKPSDTTC